MSDTSLPNPEIESVPAPAQATELPSEPFRWAIYTLTTLAVLAAAIEAQAILLPIAVAFLMNFLFRPAVRWASKYRVPAPLMAALVVVILGSIMTSAVYALKGPANEWLSEAPYSLAQLQRRIAELREPIADVREASEALAELNPSSGSVEAVVIKNRPIDQIVVLEATSMLVSIFTTMVILFFVLAWGEQFFRNLLSVIPQYRNRRGLVETMREIQQSITRYLVTVTLINISLGAVVALSMYLLDMRNPILWGVLAALLNYIPYLGPALMALILAFVATISTSSIGEAILVPLVFLAITSIEGNFITPYAVGNQLTLNPLIIFLSLLLWFWMWGFIGALLTVPILVCIKASLAHSRGKATHLAKLLD